MRLITITLLLVLVSMALVAKSPIVKTEEFASAAKTRSASVLKRHPAVVRAYFMMIDAGSETHWSAAVLVRVDQEDRFVQENLEEDFRKAFRSTQRITVYQLSEERESDLQKGDEPFYVRERPNQALQPTRMLVTVRADARPAPSTRVADL